MESGPSRKRLRRSTRSCYQCRVRKVKCQLTDEVVQTCSECLKTGAKCTLQAPRDELPSENSAAGNGLQHHESRLERIESLLQRLVEAQEQTRPPEGPCQEDLSIPITLWDDFTTRQATCPVVDAPERPNAQPDDLSDTKQSLLALLPTTEEALAIVTSSTGLRWGAENPPGSVLNTSDAVQLLESSTIASSSATNIAKVLLLFALYMQQLPPSSDSHSGDLQDIESSIALIVERVKLFILTHEDEACSMEGLECLVLLANIQLNDCATREAWRTFQIIQDLGRLEGIHKSFSLSARNSSSIEVALRRRIWLSAVCGDCWCSLCLGLEPGLGIAPFGVEDESWIDPFADFDANVQRRISLILARVAQRNAIGLHGDIKVLQEIDESLDRLQAWLPSSWWQAPSFSNDRPLDSASEPNRLICQLWFHLTRLYAHMPVAFEDASIRSERSLEICIEATRFIITRYLGLRHAHDQLSRCKGVEHLVFLAALVLLLDRVILEQVIETFGALSKKSMGGCISTQSATILSDLIELDDSSLEGGTGSTHVVNLSKDACLDAKTRRRGMEDIIVSSILPSLGAESPASRLAHSLLGDVSRLSQEPKASQAYAIWQATNLSNGTVNPTALPKI